MRVSILNTSGIEVLTRSASNTGLLNLPTQNLASGQYFVLIYQGEHIIQKQAIEIIH